jgi:outer membrane protein, heavy metal efflux system
MNLKIFGIFSFLYILLPTSALAQSSILTLESFLEKVVNESPDLVIENANVETAQAKATGVRINPPMVGFMQMKENGITQDGYEISQEIPFPTKMVQDKKVRDLELDTQKETSHYQKTLILNEARSAYLNFWSAFEKLQILKDKHHWLKHHVTLTRSATRSDSLAQIHLLEVESDSDLIENEILAVEAELIEKRNSLRIFAPSLNVEMVVPKEPALPQIEVQKSTGALISIKEKQLATFEAEESLKKQAYAPDLFLRLRNYNGNESTPKNQEIMVGVSLPFLYFWQPKAGVAEASAQKIKAQAELQRAKIEFETRLSTLTKKIESLKAQLANLNEKLIPRADKRRKLVTTLSTRTMEGLDEHKSVVIGALDLRMKAIDLRIEYENTFKEILRITGVEEKVGQK